MDAAHSNRSREQRSPNLASQSRTAKQTDQPLGASELAAQRTRLFRAQAIVRAIARLLHETYTYTPEEPDLGYALDAVDDIIDGVITDLDPSPRRPS